MAGHFARIGQTDPSNIVFCALIACDICTWRHTQQEYDKLSDKWFGAHGARFNCWRWEQPFENYYGMFRRTPQHNPIYLGWMMLAQDRAALKSGELPSASAICIAGFVILYCLCMLPIRAL